MLRAILRRAAGLDTADTATLARELRVTRHQIRRMLDDLERLGYLEEIVRGCEQPCERCPLRSACLYHHRPRVWTLTRKGERAAA